MLSSLDVLTAPGAISSRPPAFQPKFKPRPRKTGNNENATSSPAAPDVVVQSQSSTAGSPSLNAFHSPSIETQPVTTREENVPLPPSPSPHSLPPTSLHSLPPRSPLVGNSQPRAATNVAASPNSGVPSRPSVSSTAFNAFGGPPKFQHSSFQHSSAPRKRRAEKLELPSDPSKINLRDFIRQGEAQERKKQKIDAAARKNQPASSSKQIVQERDQSFFAPQVEIVDGRIVVNQASLQVEARDINRDDLGDYRRVEESSSKLNYHSYMKKTPRDRWRAEETEMFFKALTQFGTDFEVIKHVFPNKTRQQIKAKYKKEEKDHPQRLEQTIRQRTSDLVHYEELANLLKSAAEKATEDEYDFTWGTQANVIEQVEVGEDDHVTEALKEKEEEITEKEEEEQQDELHMEEAMPKKESSAVSATEEEDEPHTLFSYELDLV